MITNWGAQSHAHPWAHIFVDQKLSMMPWFPAQGIRKLTSRVPGPEFSSASSHLVFGWMQFLPDALISLLAVDTSCSKLQEATCTPGHVAFSISKQTASNLWLTFLQAVGGNCPNLWLTFLQAVGGNCLLLKELCDEFSAHSHPYNLFILDSAASSPIIATPSQKYLD